MARHFVHGIRNTKLPHDLLADPQFDMPEEQVIADCLGALQAHADEDLVAVNGAEGRHVETPELQVAVQVLEQGNPNIIIACRSSAMIGFHVYLLNLLEMTPCCIIADKDLIDR